MLSKNKVFAANMNDFPVMMDYINGLIKHLEPKIIFDSTLACEEILVNIISYAYPDDNGQLEIGWEEDSEHNIFKLTFEDAGVPFNPLLGEEPDLSVPIDKREVGGLGLLMIRKLTDDAQYSYVNGKNRLIITKKMKGSVSCY